MSGFGSIINGSNVYLTSLSASVVSASTYYGLPAGGGATSPGGSDKQIQYNSGSSFAGSSQLTFDYSTNTLSSSIAQFTTITGSTILGTTITGSNISGSGTLRVGTSITVGGGDAVTKMKVYSVTVSSWNSINGGSTSQQTGTLSTGSYSGLTTSDTLFVNATNHSQWTTSSCVLLSVSASTNQAWFTWRNVSASAATPPTGTYKIFAITV